MDLLKCVCCAAPQDDDHPALLDDPWIAVQCPLCMASTPPCDSPEQAVEAWNAMLRIVRAAEGAAPIETMTVHIPVVLYRLTADGAPRVKVPWFHPSKEVGPPQIEVIAQGALGHTAQRGDVLAANAHVITAVLPVPQPLRVVDGSAETVGVGIVTYPDEEGGADG